jgi:hypothetical protein
LTKYESSEALNKLVRLNVGAYSNSAFAADYVKDENANLAKLSQALYMVLKESTLSSSVVESLEDDTSGSINTLDKFFDTIESGIDDMPVDFVAQHYQRELLGSIRNFSGSAKDFEDFLKDQKAATKGVVPTIEPLIVDRGVYTRDTNTSTVRDDSGTNLLWQDDGDVSDSSLKKTYEEALSYCSDLETVSGYGQWRLPSDLELLFIIDKNATTGDIAINSNFTSVVAEDSANGIYPRYWTSTAYQGSSIRVVVVDFDAGDDYVARKSETNYTRCVSDKLN